MREANWWMAPLMMSLNGEESALGGNSGTSKINNSNLQNLQFTCPDSEMTSVAMLQSLIEMKRQMMNEKMSGTGFPTNSMFQQGGGSQCFMSNGWVSSNLGTDQVMCKTHVQPSMTMDPNMSMMMRMNQQHSHYHHHQNQGPQTQATMSMMHYPMNSVGMGNHILPNSSGIVESGPFFYVMAADGSIVPGSTPFQLQQQQPNVPAVGQGLHNKTIPSPKDSSNSTETNQVPSVAVSEHVNSTEGDARVRGLPQNGIDAQLLIAFSKNFGETSPSGDDVYNTEVVDNGYLYHFLRNTRFAGITPKQYRAAVRRAVGENTQIPAELSEKLKARMDFLGRSHWGFKKYVLVGPDMPDFVKGQKETEIQVLKFSSVARDYILQATQKFDSSKKRKRSKEHGEATPGTSKRVA